MIVAEHFPRSYSKFCDFTQDYADLHKKKIDLRSVNYLRLNGSKCIGYCDEDGVTIATKNRFSASTYIHEFAHMTQVVENHPLWNTEDIDDKIFPVFNRMEYLFKNGVKDWSAFYNTILLERDCERRTMKLIKGFKLPVNLERYAKRTNVYLFLYQYIYLRRKWVNSSSIYKPELVSLMPDKIVSPKKLRSIDMDMMEMYDKLL